MTFNNLDRVNLKGRTEIANCFYLDENVKGLIIDQTVPNYYLVKFDNYGAYWVDGKYLKKGEQ